MTDEKKPISEHVVWLYSEIEKLVCECHPEFHTHWRIACIMRHAAGLPYKDTPVAGWVEDGTPELFSIVYDMVSAASGPYWERPRTVAEDLYKLRYSLRELKQKMKLMDKRATGLINE